MKKKTGNILIGSSLAGALGLALVFFQVEDAVDLRTTTEEELGVAFATHQTVDVEPMQKSIAVSDRRWARLDFNHYVEKICIFNEGLSSPEWDEFDAALDMLGYFPWKGCNWALQAVPRRPDA